MKAGRLYYLSRFCSFLENTFTNSYMVSECEK